MPFLHKAPFFRKFLSRPKAKYTPRRPEFRKRPRIPISMNNFHAVFIAMHGFRVKLWHCVSFVQEAIEFNDSSVDLGDLGRVTKALHFVHM